MSSFENVAFQNIDSIFQLDQRWAEENVSCVFTHVSREDFLADPEFHKAHVGGSLLEKLLEIARQNGIKPFSSAR